MLGPGFIADFGDYTNTDTATGTLQVSGGYVVAALFFDNNGNALDANSATSTVTLSAKTTSGAVTSITVTPGGTAVTAGTYLVVHGGE